jgi:hypothetical protein
MEYNLVYQELEDIFPFQNMCLDGVHIDTSSVNTCWDLQSETGRKTQVGSW